MLSADRLFQLAAVYGRLVDHILAEKLHCMFTVMLNESVCWMRDVWLYRCSSHCYQRDPKSKRRPATTWRRWTWSTLTQQQTVQVGRGVARRTMRMQTRTKMDPGSSGSSVPTSSGTRCSAVPTLVDDVLSYIHVCWLRRQLYARLFILVRKMYSSGWNWCSHDVWFTRIISNILDRPLNHMGRVVECAGWQSATQLR